MGDHSPPVLYHTRHKLRPINLILFLSLFSSLLPLSYGAYEIHNLPSHAELLERSRARYPDEYQRFPIGYDLGPPPLIGNATIKSLWRSPSAKGEEKYPRPWPHLSTTPIKPKLLLNILSMNEAENFDKYLPQWAKIIDYFVIGVDVKNSDNSVAIIKRHLGHLPGEIAEVKFDGMGPTWSLLVEMGIKNFPRATHQIAVDADYAPMLVDFDRNLLSMRCASLHFTLHNIKGSTTRTCNWLFRSIPGARMIHRVHHLLRAPDVDPQSQDGHTRNCVINFPVTEHGGGYGDASGYAAKQLRYIVALKQDVIDYPDDPLPFYYLGHTHLDYYDTLSNKTSPEANYYLNQSIYWFEKRADLWSGHLEEKWFSMIKIAEIYHRVLRNGSMALEWYGKGIKLDPSRAEPVVGSAEVNDFILRNYPEAEAFYRQGAMMKAPKFKDYFFWPAMYRCIAKYLYANFIVLWSDATLTMMKTALKLLEKAQCDASDATMKTPEEQRALIARLKRKIEQKQVEVFNQEQILQELQAEESNEPDQVVEGKKEADTQSKDESRQSKKKEKSKKNKKQSTKKPTADATPNSSPAIPKSPDQLRYERYVQKVYDNFRFYDHPDRDQHVLRLNGLHPLFYFSEFQFGFNVDSDDDAGNGGSPAATTTDGNTPSADKKIIRVVVKRLVDLFDGIESARSRRDLEKFLTCRNIRSLTRPLFTIAPKPVAAHPTTVGHAPMVASEQKRAIQAAYSVCRSVYFDDELF